MNTDTNLPAVIPCAAPTVRFLLDTCLSGARNENTTRAYKRTLDDFATFLQAPDALTALRALLEHPHGTANAVVSAYRNHLMERGMAPASVSSRLGALRSIVKDARRFGLVNWQLDIRVGRVENYRETAGPGAEKMREMFDAVEQVENEAKRARDRVILRMLYDLGLRRNELASLDLKDIDFVAGKAAVTAKGKSQKQLLTIPKRTIEAIRKWIDHRGTYDGPLVVNLDRANQNAAAGRRLSGEGIRRIVGKYGDAAGIKCRPHMIRHRSITALLEKGHDVRAVQKFSRHAKLDTLCIYDDRRKDVAGELANMLSED